MLLSAIALAVISATPVKLAAPGFNAVDIDPNRADFFVDYFADQLTAQGGLRITTKSEISALIGMERQKALLGCTDASAQCLAELAGALGVDALIVGNLVKVGTGVAATVKIVRANDAEPIASASGRFDDDGRLLDWLRDLAPGMAQRVRARFGGGDNAPPSRESPAIGSQPAEGDTISLVALPGRPAHRLIVGLVSLGYEYRPQSGPLGFGLHAHAMAGPRFLARPQFAVGAYGGPFVRWAFLRAGAWEVSTLATLGFGATQDYDGTLNIISLGVLVAPAIEVSFNRFSLAVEAPLHVVKTYDNTDGAHYAIPVLVRLSYAFLF